MFQKGFLKKIIFEKSFYFLNLIKFALILKLDKSNSMLFQGIKNKALAKRYDKLLASQHKNFNPNLSHGVKTIGIITDDLSFDIAPVVDELSKLINVAKDSISIVFYSNKELGEKDFLYFTPKSLDWKGKISSETVSQFIYYPFDILINYSKEDNKIVNMIVAMSKAKFKVGYDTVDNRLYQFMLTQSATNTQEFNKELVRYLKILKIL